MFPGGRGCDEREGAETQYLMSTTVANGGSYSWDDPNWNANPASGSTGPYTPRLVYPRGSFARFYNGAGDNYTVTVNAAESMAGMFLNAGSGTTLTIEQCRKRLLEHRRKYCQASQNGFSWLTQGFLTGGGTVNLVDQRVD